MIIVAYRVGMMARSSLLGFISFVAIVSTDGEGLCACLLDCATNHL